MRTNINIHTDNIYGFILNCNEIMYFNELVNDNLMFYSFEENFMLKNYI